MAVDREQLNAALSLMREDEKGIYYSGQLALLPSQLYGNIFQSVQFDRERISNEAQLRDLYYYLTHCKNDLNDILTIVFRLEWQKEIKSRGELDSPLWERFVSTDIDLFHIEIRSIFDYIAKALIRISGSPGQVPDSFRKLKEWIADNPNRVPRFGQDLAQIITSCNWFSEIRGVRDAIVHSGGVTFVYPEESRILFQVKRGIVQEGINRKIILKPEIMYDENIADFELYAGLYIGYLLTYLESVSALINSCLTLRNICTDAKTYHPGLYTVRAWIESLLKVEPYEE